MAISKARPLLAGLLLGAAPLWERGAAREDLVLTLEHAVEQAVSGDDWLTANELEERALLEESVALGQLPDPRVAVGLANMPLDTFDFDQEPMTQLRIGFNQAFPRGDSLALGEARKRLQSEVNPFLREDRRAGVALTVSHLWLDAFLSEQSVALIESDRALFEQLVDIASSRYSAAAGPARQQDLVRAELELVRLEDRLAVLRQRRESSRQRLAQWLPDAYVSAPLDPAPPEPATPGAPPAGLGDASSFFGNHPRILAHRKRIQAADAGVALARQSLKPSYSVGAFYGYRDGAPPGLDRADFISLDISFDLPIFPERRQHPRIRASQHNAAARGIELTLLYREFYARYRQAAAELAVLDERRALHSGALLGQINDLTQATLSAYTVDEGDFEEVMRAYIGELNTKIELLQIDVERRKILARLDYLLAGSGR